MPQINSRQRYRRGTSLPERSSNVGVLGLSASVSNQRYRSKQYLRSSSLARFLSSRNYNKMAEDETSVKEKGSDDTYECSSTEESNISGEGVLLSSTVIKVHRKDQLEDYDSVIDYRQHDGCVHLDRSPCSKVDSGCGFDKISLFLSCFGHNQDIYLDDDSEPCAPSPCSKTMRKKASSPRGVDEDLTEIECTLNQPTCEDYVDGSKNSIESLPLQIHLSAVKNTMPHPSDWLQTPLLLLATPGSGTIVRRIRRLADPCYFNSQETPMPSEMNPYTQLPINNGKEAPLHSLVIDFETPSFAGTALFRIRNSDNHRHSKMLSSRDKSEDNNSSDDSSDYFGKYNRKFQLVVRGRFLRQVVMADCMSGLLLDQCLATAGSTNTKSNRQKRKTKADQEGLPPKWVLRSAVRVAGLFSPRMDADLECIRPRIFSPLCSMAQSINVSRNGQDSNSMDISHSEPHPHSSASLVQELKKSLSNTKEGKVTNPVQHRKKAFEAVYDDHIDPSTSVDSPCFDPNKEYTFEFLQHLIDYNDLSLDFGSLIGKIRLGGALRGQPVRVITGALRKNSKQKTGNSPLGMNDLDCLWSFDLWHESLYVEQ